MTGGEATIEFDSINLCNIYLNLASKGCDFFKANGCPPANIVVDTFTVLYPQRYHIATTNDWGYQMDDVSWEIDHAVLEQYNTDLFASPTGMITILVYLLTKL